MATFKVRVEDLVGSVGDDAFLSDVLTEGSRYVADRLKPERLILYATDKTDTDGTTGIAITSGRPLSAHKSGYEAKLIPRGQVAKALDADSLNYAISTDPSWYIDTTKGYVIPGGGTIKWFGYPTVAYGDQTITNYPSEAYGAVVLYAAIQGQSRKISDLVATTMAGISFAITQTLPAVGVASLVYTKPTFSGVYTDIATALTNQDVELAQGHGNKVSLYLQQYGADMQNELNEFNAQVQSYQMTLAGYDREIAEYQAEVQKEVGRIQSIIQQYVSMYQGYFELLKSLKEEFERLVSTL
jgi:hypothetical protein